MASHSSILAWRIPGTEENDYKVDDKVDDYKVPSLSHLIILSDYSTPDDGFKTYWSQ